MAQILSLENVTLAVEKENIKQAIVKHVSFSINEGEIVALVGESGSGKSVTAQSIIGLNQESIHIDDGNIAFQAKELTNLQESEWNQIRGKDISFIFQDPLSSLNPTMKVGKQITEVVLQHGKKSKREAKEIAINLLTDLGIHEAEKRFEQYPHQLSGGMRQRICLAIAFACHPKLVIADEPTTALDVTIQKQIMGLLKERKEKQNTSILLITHDLALVREVADRVVVMYGGRVVEKGTIQEVIGSPNHPYTKSLLQAIPNMDDSEKVLRAIEGTTPSIETLNSFGCPFVNRCPVAIKECIHRFPERTTYSKEHSSHCWQHVLEHNKAKSKEKVNAS
ncbi:peptide ABC transporter ATP-binding protein [Bacillus thuringiensis]|uniref:Peptide ABC transporter ATP-binding protein n=1 Tax=Bacillus thuringiensis TaxID=1428 RepID=A0A9X6TU81_BACTU|nr:ABC transporter ATP-binding protein [Bacillus thuringiensis]PEC70963.1 peptide ABC transporter ATP-binding protein [Bacillus thuringiensis]PED10838.1 peptide ABC transporter ATP-binding protein [Bacillus thuringiensis]PEF87334.1 peptide ABC transporter ATP-binding protein [Bacillus thuringiensis]PES47947.1 peptide ABC transporter ATP-binding protein [Bacillus thuringiensis]PFC25991.1 peptide ABC transporter ATP-binding protein [Bacillus thuringiensis]